MRVGIITFYNGNINYGGILQSYALQHVIESMGYECKQICLDNAITETLTKFQKVKLILELGPKAIYIYKRKKKQEQKEKKLSNIRKLQSDGFKKFELSIPHTDKIYRADETDELNQEFDIFVCGSDQIWTPYSGGFRQVPHKWNYFLAFTNKRKISYAASFGADYLPIEFENKIIPLINKLDAISVREENAKRILQSKINKDITVVLDPVFLLNRQEWEAITVKPKEANYIFSYLLGKQEKNRFVVTQVAKELDKVLIAIPFIGELCEKDFDFGDISKIGATPEEFLGFISDADYVISDSFHCIVFALIFKKQFAVLKRSSDKSKESMNSRLYNLLLKVGLEDRIINSDCKSKSVKNILKISIDYDRVGQILKQEIISSLEWLRQSL